MFIWIIFSAALAASPEVRVNNVDDAALAAAVEARARDSVEAVRACAAGGSDPLVAFAEVGGRIEAYGGSRESGRCAAAVVAGWPADGLATASGWLVFPAGEGPPSSGSPPWLQHQLAAVMDPPGDVQAILGFEPLIAWQLWDQAERDQAYLVRCNATRGSSYDRHVLALRVEGGRVLPASHSGKIEQCFGHIISDWRTQGRVQGAGRFEFTFEPPRMGEDFAAALAGAGITLVVPSDKASTTSTRPVSPFEALMAPKGRVHLDLAPGAKGPSVDESRAALQRHQGQVSICYEQLLPTAPHLAGELTLALSVVGGTTTSVEQTADSTGSAELIACVRSSAGRWRWSERVEDGVLNIVMVFEAPVAPSP